MLIERHEESIGYNVGLVAVGEFEKLLFIIKTKVKMSTKDEAMTVSPNGQQTDVMRWVAVSERLPEIDTSDKWNNDNKITKDVLCWSKEWGIRFGRYFYSAGFWTINGVTSSKGITVEYWMDVKPPFA